MEFINYLLIAVGTLATFTATVLGVAYKSLLNRIDDKNSQITNKEAEITTLKIKLEKYETITRQDMERTINANIAIVESLLPALNKILDEEK